MNSEALILFLILLLGLVLCSFLGGNCGTEGFNGGMTDRAKNTFNSNSNRSQNTSGSSTSSNVNYDNYNHYQGSSTELVNGSTYYGEKGGSVVVNTNSDGTQNLQLVLESGEAPITLTSEQSSSSTIEGYTNFSNSNGPLFYGPNGETAAVININNEQQGLRVKISNKTIILKPSKNYVNSLTPPVYYGPNGETAVVITTSNGLPGFRLKTSNGTIIFTQSTSSSPSSSSSYNNSNVNKTVYYGANGIVATVVDLGNGQKIIRVKTPKGNYIYSPSGTYYNPNEISNTQYYGSTGAHIQQYNGAYGGSATAVTGPYGNTAYYAQGPNGNAIAGTTSNTYDPYYNANATQYYGPNGGSATTVTGPYGNTAYYAEGPYGNAVAGTNANNNQNYYDTLPPGIPASQIPPGQEDLYILKSQVVPPVCPACPVQAASCPREEPCPPCEPCGRCPEPAFECKKVPNYNAIDNNYLPTPVLADFSTFGM